MDMIKKIEKIINKQMREKIRKSIGEVAKYPFFI